MDSGYDAVLVDVNVATTNGINGTNGTHEEVAEMKTRSKVAVGDAATDDDSAKPKIRVTRTATVQNDKDGSDTERKDKKKNLRSGSGDAEEAPGAKSVSKESANTKPAAGAANATSKATAQTAPPSSVTKKKVLERDDDSGINSRASSVSNDDGVTPARMRTRSSRASEISSTSTPAYKRGGGARVPLSIYEYDAASFDDDLPLTAAFDSKSAGASSAQKRKAVVYVEEMEDDEAPQDGAESAEPQAKRSATFLVSAGAGIVTSLLYPLRKLRSGIAAIRPYKAQSSETDVISVEQDEKTNSAESAVAAAAVAESSDTTAPTDAETEAQCSDQPPTDTCSLM